MSILTPSNKYRGVCWNKAKQKWEAYICVVGRKLYLGLFVDEDDAADAYALAVRLVEAGETDPVTIRRGAAPLQPVPQRTRRHRRPIAQQRRRWHARPRRRP